MAALRKSRRSSRKASRKASRRGRRRQKAGGTVTIYFMLIGGAVSNVFSSDPGFTVTGTATPGQVKLGGASPAKVTGITVNALGNGSTTWDPASAAGTPGSMNTVVSGTTKFYAAKGASTMGVMRPTGVGITTPLTAATDNITLYNLLQGASWKIGTASTTAVSTSGAIPPGGTANANMRIILVTNP